MRLQVLVARTLTGELGRLTPDEREDMETALLDTKEGQEMDSDAVDALSNRKLAEMVFLYSFGKQMTRDHGGNVIMAARTFLHAAEERLDEVSRRRAEAAERELREAQRRRIFNEGLLLPPPSIVVSEDAPWVLLPDPTLPYEHIASAHQDVFRVGDIVHVLSETDGTRRFYRVGQEHTRGDPNVIFTRERHQGNLQVSLLSSVEPFTGIDFKRLSKTIETDERLVDVVADTISNHVHVEPCVYVGQEVLPGIVVTALRVGPLSVSYAAIPTEHVDIADVEVIEGRCFVCTSVSTAKCGGCERYAYCSDECHAFHWKFGKHDQACNSSVEHF